MASHCSTGRVPVKFVIISVGLIDEVEAACDGVRTVCDHAKIAVAAIAIVKIEKNNLRIVAPFGLAK
jgi:hypothetical protein